MTITSKKKTFYVCSKPLPKQIWFYVEDEPDTIIEDNYTYKISSPYLSVLKKKIKEHHKNDDIVFGKEKWRPVLEKHTGEVMGWIKKVKVHYE